MMVFYTVLCKTVVNTSAGISRKPCHVPSCHPIRKNLVGGKTRKQVRMNKKCGTNYAPHIGVAVKGRADVGAITIYCRCVEYKLI